MSEEEYRVRINDAVANAYAQGHANGVLGVGVSSPPEVLFAFMNYWNRFFFHIGEMYTS